ncbi:MAG: hypothetical protein ACHP6I_01250, partial [Rickettsiales bacterium]
MTENRYLYLLIFAVMALYAPAIFYLPSLDDIYHLNHAKEFGLNIFMPSDGVIFRPWQIIINGLNYKLFSRQVYFTESLNILFYGLNIYLLYRLSERLFGRGGHNLFVAFIYAFHSVNTASVIQMDTISQNLNSTAILLLLIYLLKAGKNYFIFLGLFLFLLGTKETSYGVAAAVPFAFYFISRDTKTSLRLFGCFLGAFALYMLCRYQISVFPFAEHLQQVQEGKGYGLVTNVKNIMLNLVMMFGSVFFLGNTQDLFLSGDLRKIFLGLGVFLSFVFMVAAVRGCYAKHLKQEVVFLLLFAAAACFPSAFFAGRVSELYSSLLTPFIALAVGYYAYNGFSQRWRQVFVGIYLVISVTAIVSKSNGYKEVGERFWAFSEQLIPVCQSSPQIICLYGNDFPSGYSVKEYSVFTVHNPYLLHNID